jgi:beta-lactam-binding protein with PASTA domain
VLIPELEGRAPDEALDELRALGLQPEPRERGGLLDELLPGAYGVCGTDPQAGERVPPGSDIEVVYSKAC